MAPTDLPTARDMIELPGRYTFKVFVKPEMVSAEQLHQLVESALGRPILGGPTGANDSRTGKYTAHTLEIYMETYEEIEALYLAFKTLDGVVMTL